jgi:hypothetical protein
MVNTAADSLSTPGREKGFDHPLDVKQCSPSIAELGDQRCNGIQTVKPVALCVVGQEPIVARAEQDCRVTLRPVHHNLYIGLG